jgi:hypothetical protein
MPVKEEVLISVEQDRLALMQMYQAGFLDGYNANSFKNKTWENIKEKCKKAFEFRFMKRIEKGVRNVRRNQTRSSKRRSKK